MQLDDSFFASIGLSDISAERKTELTQQLVDLTQNQIALVLAERLTDEQLERFNTLSDSDGDEAAVAYIEEVMPDYQQVVQEQAASVKEAFVQDMTMLLDLQNEEEGEAGA
jgi:hypothetical protein